jgi:hypothetical protein
MAIVRGLAFKVNAGPQRCGSYQAALDASLGLDRLLPMVAVRALGECDRPPITTWLGSGICRRAPAGCSCSAPPHDHGREQAWTWM